MEKTQTFQGSCHCGNVKYQLGKAPEWLVSCNCSICRRIGALWTHAETSDVILNYEKGATIAYIWGDKTLSIHSCKNCGCTTHWESLDQEQHSRMGLNFRMCSDHELSDYRVRHFDGADTWEFLD